MTEIRLPSFLIQNDNPYLRVGVLFAHHITVLETPEMLIGKTHELCRQIMSEQESPADQTRQAIRDLLRHGGYKPSGRGRPASEYLANAAKKGEFPIINNVVDINNLVSLKYGLPICLLDLDKTGPQLLLRYGRDDESYVFNQSGQSIQLKGLLCICSLSEDDRSIPMGNPVKDSMIAKISQETTNAVGVVFGDKMLFPENEFEKVMKDFEQLMVDFAGAQNCSFELMTARA